MVSNGASTCMKKLPKVGGLNPNHPKSFKILQGAHVWKKISTVGNWYFHLFKRGKITTWQEVQAISAEYERSAKMHGAF